MGYNSTSWRIQLVFHLVRHNRSDTDGEGRFLKEYKPILVNSNELEETQYQPLEQSDVKEIIHDVLQELQSRESHVAKNGNKKN